MSKRGENIWHRKDGRWEARYIKDRLNGRAVYGYVYAKTYKEVKEKQMSKAKEVDSITAPKCNIFIRNCKKLPFSPGKRLDRLGNLCYIYG